MSVATTALSPCNNGLVAMRLGRARVINFETLYDDYVDFVWRSARRLGIDDAAIDDVVQEIFLVVHRRLDAFEGRSTHKTWLFGITLRVVRNHQRSARRKREQLGRDVEAVADSDRSPHALAENAQAVELLYRLLEQLPDGQREVFALAELEHLSGPEIADAVGISVNTVYSRLRLARRAFERAVSKLSTGEGSS